MCIRDSPTPAASVSQTTCTSDLTCPLVSSQDSAWLLEQQLTNEPAPSLHSDYRSFITTTSRSAGAHRIGTQRLTVSAARRAPSRHQQPSQATGSRISTRLPTFPVAAADQARAAFTPDTTWPVNGFPPDSSREYAQTSVLMSSLIFRCFVDGSLSLAFLIPA